MKIGHVVVGVVEGAEVRAGILDAITSAGATPSVCTEATAIAGGAAVDAIVFDLPAEPEALLPIARALAGDPRTRDVPRVIVVAGATAAARIAPFGPGAVVAAEEMATLTAAVEAVVAGAHARHASARRLHLLLVERRATAEQVARLGDEASTLSHDGRVLLGVILGYASNLRDEVAGPVTATQKTHASNIVQASTDATTLVERYVSAARQIAEEVAGREHAVDAPARDLPRRTHTDLGELVRTTVALLGGVAASKQIRLTSDVASPVSAAWCDAMQIKQALVNLLSNALKFTPPGGSVEVVVRAGAPASSRGGSTARREIELAVIDSGPGIPVEHRARVFDRGARLERDAASPGTGIGLAVVRDVVEQHGGAVRIDDGPDGGTSVVLTLPSDLRSRVSDRVASAPRAVHEGSE